LAARVEASAPRWWLDPRSVQSILAYGVVLGGGSLLAAAWLVPGMRDPQPLASALVALMGTVLGWYFGSQGLDRAERAASRAKERAAEALEEGAEAASLVRELEAAMRTLQDRAKRATDVAREQADLLAELREEPGLREKIDAAQERIRRR
jgi:hypothetical protein